MSFTRWLKDNAGTIGTVAGGALGIGASILTGGALPPNVGLQLGMGLGGSIGGGIQKANQQEAPTINKGIGTVQMKYGGLISYYGKSHEKGGIPIGNGVEVEGGETRNGNFIYSDSLKYNGKTYAQNSKDIVKRYKGNDAITSETRDRALNNLANMQEMYKQYRGIKNKEKEMRLGGGIGLSDIQVSDYTDLPPYTETDAQEALRYANTYGTNAINYLQSTKPTIKGFGQSVFQAGKSIGSDVGNWLKGEGNTQDTVAGVGMSLGSIYDVYRGLQKPKYKTMERMQAPTLERINPFAGQVALETQGAIGRENIRRNSGYGAGNLLNNYAAITGNTGRAMGQYLGQTQQANAQIQAQEAAMRMNANQVNIGQSNREEEINQMERDVRDNQMQRGLTGIGNTFGTVYANRLARKGIGDFANIDWNNPELVKKALETILLGMKGTSGTATQ